jgi:hypothetical protein
MLKMNTTNLQSKSGWFEVAVGLLPSLVMHAGAASPAYSAIPAQPQAAPQPTNGRGAIGLNCRPEGNGCRVGRIIKDGPAERTGLRVGDLVLRLNSSDQTGVVEQIVKNPPGTKITLPVQRGTERIQVPITVDDQLAIALRGAALGDPAAEETLSRIYAGGVGVPKDTAEALKWLRKAAESGYDIAEYELAAMYARGEGVARDDSAAFAWYRRAAEQGNALAEYLVGQMYSEGRGVTKDDKAAAEWFRKGAEHGNPLAESNLGWCYENGRGVPKDLTTAIAWYKKAADQGFEPAKEKLAKLHP